MEKIILTDEDGGDFSVYVMEETQLSGVKYLLVAENEEGDSDAYILKVVGESDDDVVYEMVEDETELSAIAKLFEELIGDEANFDF